MVYLVFTAVTRTSSLDAPEDTNYEFLQLCFQSQISKPLQKSENDSYFTWCKDSQLEILSHLNIQLEKVFLM